MSIQRSNLVGSGAPKVTYGAAQLWTRDDVSITLAQALTDQRSSMYGRVTKTKGGRTIEINLPIFGLGASLTTLFPSTILNPSIGSRMFGASDTALVLHAKNGDRLTIHNALLTGLTGLRLAANQAIFSGTARFTGLLRNGYNPTQANSYFTFDNATYAEGSFSLATLKAKAWSAAWGSRTGFTSILTQDGWTIDWEVSTTPDVVDGLGPVDMFLDGFGGKASCIPVGPTEAQLESNSLFQGTGADIGADISASCDDLVLTDGTNTVTLKAAALVETGLVFAPSKKRTGQAVWEATRGFSAGVAQALATVA